MDYQSKSGPHRCKSTTRENFKSPVMKPVFGLQEETRVPGESPDMYEENLHTERTQTEFELRRDC